MILFETTVPLLLKQQIENHSYTKLTKRKGGPNLLSMKPKI